MSVTKSAFKRLLSDVRDIMKDPLDSENIYYIHDEDNILQGYVMVIGAENTPYAHGCYFFTITYPSDYPCNPPTFKFLTNDGKIRMNPNLYRNGKVCISILNTWHGEQWSSCQTIRSTLLTLSTILNDAPLLNEPGYSRNAPDFDKYQEIIRFKNIEIAILRVIKEDLGISIYDKFKNQVIQHFNQNSQKVIELCDAHKTTKGIYSTYIYTMKVDIDYSTLKTKLEQVFKQLL